MSTDRWSGCAKAFRSVSGCESGSIGLTFSIVFLLLGMGIGAAVDLARIARLKSYLQSQLDVAVMGAIQSKSQAEVEQSIASSFASRPAPEGVAVQTSVGTFDGMSISAAAQADLPMTFARLMGRDTARVTTNASALRAAGYLDVYIALDLSSSLGMAATEADRARLEALTKPYSDPAYGSRLPQGCAFGCHRREGWEPDGKTVYQIAKEAGIKLREDELNSQFGGLVDLLLDTNDPAVQQGMRRVSLFGFSNWSQRLITDSVSPSAIKSSLAGFADYDRYETDYNRVFGEVEVHLGAQGTGTQSAPTKMLVLISDGIDSRDAFFSQKAINTALCQSIKDKGFQIAVVELKYPVMESNPLYDDTVKPVQTQITPAMQQCASLGWYFQATDNSEIPAKFAELTTKISRGMARLTQ